MSSLSIASVGFDKSFPASLNLKALSFPSYSEIQLILKFLSEGSLSCIRDESSSVSLEVFW